MKVKRGIIVLGLLSAAGLPTWAQQIKGVVIDKNSKETLIGAVITAIESNGKTDRKQETASDLKAITDIDGNFQLDGLKKDKT